MMLLSMALYAPIRHPCGKISCCAADTQEKLNLPPISTIQAWDLLTSITSKSGTRGMYDQLGDE